MLRVITYLYLLGLLGLLGLLTSCAGGDIHLLKMVSQTSPVSSLPPVPVVPPSTAIRETFYWSRLRGVMVYAFLIEPDPRWVAMGVGGPKDRMINHLRTLSDHMIAQMIADQRNIDRLAIFVGRNVVSPQAPVASLLSRDSNQICNFLQNSLTHFEDRVKRGEAVAVHPFAATLQMANEMKRVLDQAGKMHLPIWINYIFIRPIGIVHPTLMTMNALSGLQNAIHALGLSKYRMTIQVVSQEGGLSYMPLDARLLAPFLFFSLNNTNFIPLPQDAPLNTFEFMRALAENPYQYAHGRLILRRRPDSASIRVFVTPTVGGPTVELDSHDYHYLSNENQMHILASYPIAAGDTVEVEYEPND